MWKNTYCMYNANFLAFKIYLLKCKVGILIDSTSCSSYIYCNKHFINDKETSFYSETLTDVFFVSIFSARCNIYILRLCYDVSVRPSVRLSV